MASAARSWQHPRWQYDEDTSEAARRSAARMASREGTYSRGATAVAVSAPRTRGNTSAPGVGRPLPVPRVAPLPSVLPRFRWRSLRAAGFIVLAGVALLVPVSLNMAATSAQYRYAQLEDRQGALKAERSALQTKVAALTAHQRVEAAAQKMGMVPGPHFEFLNMGAGDGTEGVAGSADSGSVR
jgi:hypothetical protein